MSEALPFTGERFIPGVPGEIWYEHWHRYHFAAPMVAGRKVLDIACGAGYGSALLARTATRVVGADISQAAMQIAPQQSLREQPDAGGRLCRQAVEFHLVPQDGHHVIVDECFGGAPTHAHSALVHRPGLDEQHVGSHGGDLLQVTLDYEAPSFRRAILSGPTEVVARGEIDGDYLRRHGIL